jgi:hypothetical protein
MRRLPAVQPLTAVNDRLSVQSTAGSDPIAKVTETRKRPFNVEVTVPWSAVLGLASYNNGLPNFAYHRLP